MCKILRPPRRRTATLSWSFVTILVSLSLLGGEMAYPQVDSSKPNFFPHHLGETWVYYVQDGAGDDTLRVTIISDSTDSQGNAYLQHKLETLNPNKPAYNYPWYEFYKVDTAGNVYTAALYTVRNPSYVRLQYFARAEIGDWWLIDTLGLERAHFSQVFGSSIFGTPTTVKNIDIYASILVYTEYYADGFGVIYRGGSDLGYAVYLIGAIIGGKKYGDTTLTSVADKNSWAPVSVAQLFPNYPNPFNGQTRIEYEIPQGGEATLSVYDVLGREVKRLVDRSQEGGHHSATLDSGNLASGVYFYRLKTNWVLLVRKMLIQK
jgi:hypothetical protein